MRLLMVSHAFPPHSSGGVEVCTAYVALALQQRGHETHVLHRIAQPERPEYEVGHGQWDSLPVTTINNTFAQIDSFEMTYRNQAIERVFADYLDRLQPDLVHFQHLTCLSTGLVEVCKSRGLPTVLTLHDYWMVCQRGQMLQPDLTLCAAPEDGKCARCMAPYIYPHLRSHGALAVAVAQSRRGVIGRAAGLVARLYGRRVAERNQQLAVDQMRHRNRHTHDMMQQVDLLLTPSYFHRSQFVRYGVDPDHIKVQYNGLRQELFENYQRVTADHVRFCFLGTVIPSKGVHVLVEAFSGIQDERATLDIHGWAPPYDGYPNYLQDLNARANPRVRFHGGYDNAGVSAILAQADVVIIPSIWYESASVIAHEAFLAKVPVIASHLGALAEFVKHEVNGLLFEPRDPADLRVQMERLLADPDLLARLAQQPGPVETMEQQATKLESIYRQLIADAGRRGWVA